MHVRVHMGKIAKEFKAQPQKMKRKMKKGE